MAIHLTRINTTAYRLFYALNHDGAAGDTLTRTNAELLVDAATAPRILALLNTPVLNDAAAVMLMTCAYGEPAAVTHVMPARVAAHWRIDYEADGNNRAQLVVESTPGQVNEGILEIQVVHSYNK